MIEEIRTRLRRIGKRRAGAAAVAGIYAVSLFFWLLAPGIYQSRSEWHPHWIISTNIEEDEAVALLRQAGAEGSDGSGVAGAITEIVSEETSEVLVTRFNRVDRVSLRTALEQLDPLDPRRDPFIESLPRYFSSNGRSLVWVRSDIGAAHLARIVRRVLGTDARVAGWFPARHLAGLGVFLMIAACTVALHRRHRIAAILTVLAWIPVAVAAAPVGAVVAAAVCFIWAQALARATSILEGNRPGSRTIATVAMIGSWPVIILGIGAAVLMTVQGSHAGLALLPALIGTTAVSVLVFLVRPVSLIRRDHDLFVPVAILDGTPWDADPLRSPPRMALLAACLIAVVVIPPLIERVGVRNRLDVPQPVVVEGATELSYESIGVLWNGASADRLPDLSDYLAHRAYQEGLAYGRGYAVPERGEVVTLSRYRENEDGAYRRFPETVTLFDESWLDAALADAPAGIVSILAGARELRGVVSAPERRLYSGYSQLLINPVYAMLALVPVMLSGSRRLRLGRTGSKVIDITRRRRQVA